jgi:hypothetical protein
MNVFAAAPGVGRRQLSCMMMVTAALFPMLA